MLAKKKSFRGAILLVVVALAVAGCTPTGPRALLKGKNYLDRGDYADAVAELKTATSLLATNAEAWNYYGVALQSAGQPAAAAKAYQTALRCNRDLVEVHFNLGCLALQQNQPETAKAELTAYTLRRPNDAEGWFKLGLVQLRLHETIAAERSFSTVIALKQGDKAEAYNGLGLARVQRGIPRDAEKFFTAAVDLRPDFAAAILNLATVQQQYLHDNRAALENYRKYLELRPRPADWKKVNALVNSLEASERKAAATVPPVERPPAPKPKPEPKPQPEPHKVVLRHEERSSRSKPPGREIVVHRPPVENRSPHVKSSEPRVTPAPVQTVEVSPEPRIVASSHITPAVTSAPPASPKPLEVPMPQEQPKRSFWQRLFGLHKKEKPEPSNYQGDGLTPLPAESASKVQTATSPPKAVATKAAAPAQPPPIFARYHYFSPPKPAAGNRTAARGAFTKARLFEQEQNWTEALKWYEAAANLDPSWFEAQYNASVLAYRLQNYALALPHYEIALAIEPDSVDARYNFALALRAAGYAPDAADQLKKILAAHPDETRAHLALANIYAQALGEKAKAREEYLKVLKLDPNNAQASDIRFWLSANPD